MITFFYLVKWVLRFSFFCKMNKGLEDATGFVLFFLFCYVFSTVCLAVRWNEKVFGFFWDEPPFFLFRGQKNKACFLECLLLQIAYGSKPSGETCHSFLVKLVCSMASFSLWKWTKVYKTRPKDFVSLSCFVCCHVKWKGVYQRYFLRWVFFLFLFHGKKIRFVSSFPCIQNWYL